MSPSVQETGPCQFWNVCKKSTCARTVNPENNRYIYIFFWGGQAVNTAVLYYQVKKKLIRQKLFPTYIMSRRVGDISISLATNNHPRFNSVCDLHRLLRGEIWLFGHHRWFVDHSLRPV